MSYKNLKNFRYIFSRTDFNFLCDTPNIKQISEIVLYNLPAQNGNEPAYIELLTDFLKNLNSFYTWIDGNNIPDIKESYTILKQELERYINILRMPESKIYERSSISKGYLRKFNKSFLYGLSKLLDGIRSAFEPSFIAATNIEREQLVKYILDTVEGFGNRFLFNKTGKNAPSNKLKSLERNELIETLGLLSNPSQARTTRNGWIDLGLRACPVRVLLIKHRNFGLVRKDIVAFVFRRSEHRDYDDQLDILTDKVRISIR